MIEFDNMEPVEAVTVETKVSVVVQALDAMMKWRDESVHELVREAMAETEGRNPRTFRIVKRTDEILRVLE